MSKYMERHRKPPSQTWRTFLRNHVGCLASIDFFVVPTATFSLLFAFVVLHHDRRRIVHLGVTTNPTAAWVAQQIREAFPWDTAPRHVIRDRDSVYGGVFRARILAMGIEEVVTAPRSPWQNPFAERVIGSIRRECLDHVVVLNERHLRRILASYLAYYHRSRTHLSLGKDAPDGRPVQPVGGGEDRRVPAGRRTASPLRTAGGPIRTYPAATKAGAHWTFTGQSHAGRCADQLKSAKAPFARHAGILTVDLFLGGSLELADGAGTCARWDFRE